MKTLVLEDNLAQRWKQVKEFFAYAYPEEDPAERFYLGFKDKARGMLKVLIAGCLKEERENYLKAGHYQRNRERRDYRNGFYTRDLGTSLGVIEDLQVPRCRKKGFQTRVFNRYQRRQREVNEAIKKVFLCGVSTRRVAEAIEPLLEDSFSGATVSRITKELNREVARFHKRKLIDQYQYLFLDGLTVGIRGALEAKKKKILSAYGITIFGTRELIDFRQAPSESEAQWEAFLNNLYQRGLEGNNLRLVTTDGCKGLHNALDMVYPYTPRQRCWKHKLKNVSNYLPKRYEEECLRKAKKIYLASTKREAVAIYKEWEKEWIELVPKAVNCLRKDMDEMLTFLDLPLEHRKKIRTTNVIERAFREVRRRIRTMSCFTNASSCDRIIYSVITHLNKQWRKHPLEKFTQFY